MCDWCQTNSIFALLPWHLCLSAVHFIRSSLLVVRTQFLIGFRIQLLFAFAFNFGSLYLFFHALRMEIKKIENKNSRDFNVSSNETQFNMR